MVVFAFIFSVILVVCCYFVRFPAHIFVLFLLFYLLVVFHLLLWWCGHGGCFCLFVCFV